MQLIREYASNCNITNLAIRYVQWIIVNTERMQANDAFLIRNIYNLYETGFKNISN